MLTLDHIAISTEALETGAAEVEEKLGVPLAPGGQHAAMGTWNRLLSLGPEEYLELIATEPGAPAPAQPRWFDLDNFAGVTRTTTWICRCDDLDAALAAAPEGTGVPWSLERADLRWRMAIPTTGLLPFSGLFPALIEWSGPAHPAPRLEDRSVRLTGLRLISPDADGLSAALAPMISDDRIEVVPGEVPRMEAVLATPSGEITL
ncbi:VOC family protein [Roseibacterium beibuensis]|uniref:VOC family protein n=1 Tax=[Roseibacterium] beibuensis TaxID=1193142 RepID=A0ABP9L6S7_9RHOB|nr:VOC family protein [Roseibacterium beibuensis]MCS6624110.1 VOC family protein [Roseibacterium beibuensis]